MPLPLILLLALQTSQQPSVQATPAPTAYPIIPVAASAEFASLAYRVEDLIAAKDFDGAAKLAQLLPTEVLELEWDGSKIPKANVAEFESARADAIDSFKKLVPNVTIKVVPKSKRLKISFEPVLATPPNATFPAGMTSFYSEDAKDPWLEAVIGLKRGNPLVTTKADDIYNDVSRSIGSALGLATTPFYGGVMAGSDLPAPSRFGMPPSQGFSARALIKLSNNLRELIQKKISIPSGKPSIHVETTSVSAGEVYEGDPVPLTVQLTNNGDAPLAYSARGDCGCIVVHEENVLPPGQTWIIRGSIDTKDIKGVNTKHIELMTNDPEKPTFVIPVNVTVKQRFEFVPDYKDGLTATDAGTAKYGVTLKLAPGAKPIRVRQAAVIGIKGTVTQKELKDSAGNLIGYRYEVEHPVILKGGPWVSELNLLTDDENLRVLRYAEHIVHGIVVMPGSVFLGSALQGKRDFRVDVVAPGLAFKIKSAKCNVQGLSTSVEPIMGIGYRIKLSYDGTRPAGPFDGQLTIVTDSPKQPSLEVAVSGTVKG